MFDNNAKPVRCWKDIVADLAMATRQHNLERRADLRKELDFVLDHRNEAQRIRATSDNKLPARNKTA